MSEWGAVTFEWDEAKRRSNIEKHKLDFIDAVTLFAGRRIVIPARPVEAELREATVGLLNGRLITVIYTMRDGRTRLISMRRARHGEERLYHAVYGE